MTRAELPHDTSAFAPKYAASPFMFEPENDIERLLMRASTQPSERPGFARALLDAQVFVLLVPDRPIVPGPNGSTTIAEGTKLSLPSAVRGEQNLVPFF